MLLSFKRYDGKMVDIDSTVIFRARPRIDSYDVAGVQTVISYDLNPADPLYQRLPTKTATPEVLALLSKALPMAQLTTVKSESHRTTASKPQHQPRGDQSGPVRLHPIPAGDRDSRRCAQDHQRSDR
jgi:hypothetical protein